MKLKEFSRNTVSLILGLLLLLSNTGCNGFFRLYTEEEIPSKIKSILKKEYKIDSQVYIEGKTLWVYVPTSYSLLQLSHQLIQKKFREQLNGVTYVTARILWNSEPGIDFYVILFVDTTLGAFIFIIGTTKDLKDYYLEKISIDEFSERRIYDQGFLPELQGDTQGKNFKYFDMKLPNFIAYLITIRTEEEYAKQIKKNADKKQTTEAIKKIKDILSWNTEQSPTGTYTLQFYIDTIPPEGLISVLKKQIIHVLKAYNFRNITYIVISTPQREWSILPEEIFQEKKKTK